MLTNRCMFFFDREWTFTIFSAKLSLWCVFVGQHAAWVQNLQLFMLSLNVHCKVCKSMLSSSQDAFSGWQALKWATSWLWARICSASGRLVELILLNFDIICNRGEISCRCDCYCRAWLFYSPGWSISKLRDTSSFAHTLINLIVTWARPSIIMWHIIRVLCI